MPFDEEYFNSDDFQQLLSSYEASVESGSTMFLDADDLVDIADYYNMKEEPERALEVVEQGLTLYPDDVLLNVFMARKALDEEDVREAEQIASRIGDKDAPDYHYLQAEILIAQGRIDEADRNLRDYGQTVDPDEYGDFVKDVANLYVDYDLSGKAYEWMLRSMGDDSDDFKELMDFVRETRFDRMGAFAYSEEDGTYAEKNYDDDVPEDVKQFRLNRLMRLQEKISTELNEEKVGRTLKVFIDRLEGDYFIGRTEYDSPEVDGEVLIPASEKLETGNFYATRITGSDEYDLYGTTKL